MRVKYLIVLLFLIQISIIKLNGQTTSLKTLTLPSPNAASLGKYGEMPVSLYSGVPQISIPIYEYITI